MSDEALEAFGALLAPEARRDPYAVYDALRELGPVVPSPLGGYAAFGYDSVAAILHARTVTSERAADMLEMAMAGREDAAPDTSGEQHPFIAIVRDMMVFRDPPDHHRLRRLVNAGFTPRAVAALRPAIQRIVDDLLEEPLARGHMEVIADLAVPLPALVVCEVLGIPGADRDAFQRWSADMISQIDITATPETLARAETSTGAFTHYLTELVSDRAANPRDDVLTALINARDAGDVLTEHEVIATAMLLLVAGYETTTNLLGNGTLALTQNHDTWKRLVADPGLVRPAIEELLRYDAPTQLLLRTATERFDLAGTPVAAGDQLIAFVGAANRDPSRFPEPDRLDIDRTDLLHLAFGHGIHACLGAPLARLEGEVAFASMAARLPGLTLALPETELAWRDNLTMRGLVSLPVAW